MVFVSAECIIIVVSILCLLFLKCDIIRAIIDVFRIAGGCSNNLLPISHGTISDKITLVRQTHSIRTSLYFVVN